MDDNEISINDISINDISINDISCNYNLVKKPTIYDRKNLIYDTHEEIRILQMALDQAKMRLVNFQNDYNNYCLKNSDKDDVKFMLQDENNHEASYLFLFLDIISFGWLSKFC